MNTGDRIIFLRNELNLSQKELADKVNINNSVLSRIESNKRPIRDDELISLAKTLDTSIDYILGISDEPHAKRKKEKENEKVKILAREANDLTDVQIDLINNMIAEFKKQNNKE